MPRRMLRDWTDSERFDGLSAEAERLFARLIMKADDFGRFHGSARLIKSICFPLLEVETADAEKWIAELSKRGLIIIYQAEGRKCLAIPNFGQRLRDSRAKFPPMDGQPVEWLPDFPELPATSGDFPPETAATSGLKSKRREDEVEEKTKGKEGAGAHVPASLDEQISKTYSAASRALLHTLNELAGKSFREVSTSLDLIQARLKEPGVDSDGCVQMLKRQCALWKDDPKMAEYLRPSTLFNKTKFNEYYAAKDIAVAVNGSAGHTKTISPTMRLVLAKDELERAERELQDLTQGRDHMDMSPEERAQRKKLRGRIAELKAELGYKV